MGSCKDGVYLGKYADLKNNLSDWTSLEDYKAPYCDTLDEFPIGPLQSDDMAHSMISLFDSARHPVSNTSSHSLKQDVLFIVWSAVVEPIILFNVLLVTIFMASIMISICEINAPRKISIGFRHKRTRRLKNTFSDHFYVMFFTFVTILRQFRLSPSTAMSRLLLFLCMFGFFCLTNYFFDYFSTSLLMTETEARIDSLKDLAERPDVAALFMKEYNLWHHFKYSKDPILQTIWKKAIIMNQNEVFRRYTTEQEKFISKIAIMSFIPFNGQIVNIYCGQNFEDPIIHTAKELFLPTYMVSIFRPGVDKTLKDRLSRCNQLFVDHGIYNRITKNPEKYHPEEIEVQICRKKLAQYNEKTSEGENEALGLHNLVTLFMSCLLLLSMALVAMVMELSVHGLMESRRQRKMALFSPRADRQSVAKCVLLRTACNGHKSLKILLVLFILLTSLYFLNGIKFVVVTK